mmetsp:Transcript_27785/g.67566  ORF Transcript_27785/g.67566 Transcript_27785/m.67566 type:complete len:1342 (-) Transcript_27785:262-4287(-)
MASYGDVVDGLMVRVRVNGKIKVNWRFAKSMYRSSDRLGTVLEREYKFKEHDGIWNYTVKTEILENKKDKAGVEAPLSKKLSVITKRCGFFMDFTLDSKKPEELKQAGLILAGALPGDEKKIPMVVDTTPKWRLQPADLSKVVGSLLPKHFIFNTVIRMWNNPQPGSHVLDFTLEAEVSANANSSRAKGYRLASELAELLGKVGTSLPTIYNRSTNKQKAGARIPKRFFDYLQDIPPHLQQVMKKQFVSSENLKTKAALLRRLLQESSAGKRPAWQNFRWDLNVFLLHIEGYAEYLDKNNERIQNKRSINGRRKSSPEDASCVKMRTIEATNSVKKEYHKVQVELEKVNRHYEPVLIDASWIPEYRRKDVKRRNRFFESLRLTMRIKLYTYNPKGKARSVHVAFQIPEQEDPNMQAVCIAKITSELLPAYKTRKEYRDFKELWGRVNLTNSHVRTQCRKVFKECGNIGRSDSAVELERKRLEWLFQYDELELYPEIKAIEKEEDRFKLFCNALNSEFLQIRSSETMRSSDSMFDILSLEALHEETTKKLQQTNPEAPVPSAEWLRLQMLPLDASTRGLLKCIDIVKTLRASQKRALCKIHADARVVNLQARLVKRHIMSVFEGVVRRLEKENKTDNPAEIRLKAEQMILASNSDDRQLIPCGDPGVPAAPLPDSSGFQDVESLCGLVPTFTLVHDLPCAHNDSWVHGHTYFSLRCRVQSPADPFRHVAEYIKIVLAHTGIHQSLGTVCRHAISPDPESVAFMGELRNAVPKYLFQKLDGRDTHNVADLKTKLGMLLVVFFFEPEYAIFYNSPPNQSCVNEVEKVLATCNLGLTNLNLFRTTMDAKSEAKVYSNNNLTDLNTILNEDPELQEKFNDSMKAPIATVAERFQNLEFAGNKLRHLEACTTEEVDILQQVLKHIDPAFENVDWEDAGALLKLEKISKLLTIDEGWKFSPYLVEFRHPQNCMIPSIPLAQPKKMDQDRHVEEYFAYDETSGMFWEQAISSYPSTTVSASLLAQRKKLDKATRKRLSGCGDKTKLFDSKRVFDILECTECGKPRCVFVWKGKEHRDVLSQNETAQLRAGVEKVRGYYTCGAGAFYDEAGHGFRWADIEKARLYVQHAVTCESEIQKCFYEKAAKPVQEILRRNPTYTARCCYCGSQENEFVDEKSVKHIYHAPCCVKCQERGKIIREWGPKTSLPAGTKLPEVKDVKQADISAIMGLPSLRPIEPPVPLPHGAVRQGQHAPPTVPSPFARQGALAGRQHMQSQMNAHTSPLQYGQYNSPRLPNTNVQNNYYQMQNVQNFTQDPTAVTPATSTTNPTGIQDESEHREKKQRTGYYQQGW